MRGEHLTTIPESLDKRSPGVTNLIRRVHNDVVRGMAHVDHSFALRRLRSTHNERHCRFRRASAAS